MTTPFPINDPGSLVATVLTLEASPDELEALAEFLKRVGWQEWRANAVDDAEADLIRAACGKLSRALAMVGFDPR